MGFRSRTRQADSGLKAKKMLSVLSIYNSYLSQTSTVITTECFHQRVADEVTASLTKVHVSLSNEFSGY